MINKIYKNGRFKLSRKDGKGIPSYITPLNISVNLINKEPESVRLDSGRLIKIGDLKKSLDFEVEFLIDIRRYMRESGQTISSVINSVEFTYFQFIENINRISFNVASNISWSNEYYYIVELIDSENIDFSETPTVVKAVFKNYSGERA